MNGSTRWIDARGLACPGPVIAVKKALEEGGFESLEILIDGPTAKENVSRFAKSQGWAVESIEESGAEATIRLRPADMESHNAPTKAEGRPGTADAPTAEGLSEARRPASTVFISSEEIGSGNKELGCLLMRGFLSALHEASPRPARIVLMNGGVKLAILGSPALGALQKLALVGVEILACGTCLDFYGVKGELATGRVSNMFEISSLLLEGPTLSL
jgi:selenium metabolism protein YedF